jgi:hypothetical protein
MALKSRKNKNSNNKSKKKYSKQVKNRPDNKIQFLNIGSTNTIVKRNDTVTNSSIDWSGNYNGKVADIHVSVDDNGRKEEMNIKLDNNDLTKLLGIPSINKQLDERLMDDFYLRDQPLIYQNQKYDYGNNYNNDNQIANIMDSLKFRKTSESKSRNNTKNKNKTRNK